MRLRRDEHSVLELSLQLCIKFVWCLVNQLTLHGSQWRIAKEEAPHPSERNKESNVNHVATVQTLNARQKTHSVAADAVVVQMTTCLRL